MKILFLLAGLFGLVSSTELDYNKTVDLCWHMECIFNDDPECGIKAGIDKPACMIKKEGVFRGHDRYACYIPDNNGKCPENTTVDCRPLLFNITEPPCGPQSRCRKGNIPDNWVNVYKTLYYKIPPCWIYEPSENIWSCFSALDGLCPFRDRNPVYCPSFTG